MRLPLPRTARILAAALLASAVLLLVLHVQIAKGAYEPAETVPFEYSDEDQTIVGLRILGATAGDIVRMEEIPTPAACGITYEWASSNETRRAQAVLGNLTFLASLARATATLLEGGVAETYIHERRLGGGQSWTGPSATAGQVTVFPGCRSWAAKIRVNASVEAPMEAGRIPSSFLPAQPGLDFVYVVNRSENANDTFEALSNDLRGDAQGWWTTDGKASIEQSWFNEANRLLSGLTILATVGGGVLLAMGLRRQQAPEVAGGTEASLTLAAAGERHLVLLRNAWITLGCVGLPLLWFGSLSALERTTSWEMPHPFGISVLGLVLAIDAGLVLLWALTMRQIRLDVANWRAAWQRFQRTAAEVL